MIPPELNVYQFIRAQGYGPSLAQAMTATCQMQYTDFLSALTKVGLDYDRAKAASISAVWNLLDYSLGARMRGLNARYFGIGVMAVSTPADVYAAIAVLRNRGA